MAEHEKDSSNNLARRYRHLFRLPSLKMSVCFASAVTILIELVVGSALHAGFTSLLAYAALTELALLLTIGIDRQILKGQNGIGTYRRLAAIAIMSNLVWLATALVALSVLFITHSEARFVALIIMGLFFAVSFRAFVFGSVFYGDTLSGLPLSVVQPVLLGIPILLSSYAALVPAFPIVAALLIGIVYVIAIEIYLSIVNKMNKIGGQSPLQLLQAFLSAWVLEDATPIESVLDSVSKTRSVSTSMIRIAGNSSGRSALIVVPGIHPGPFYPVGSSNLPADIYSSLRTTEGLPLTVHSISDHELNLPSKSEVKKYVASLREAKAVDNGKLMSQPVVRKQGKATVTGIAFGSTCLIALTQAPYGMEDFPVWVRQEIEKTMNECGFKLPLVIDTHNSQGPKPNESECNDVVIASRGVIEELAKSKMSEFRMGFAHSAELEASIPKDIGPAGIGMLFFHNDGAKFCLVLVDANNSKIGFREETFHSFEEKTGVKILELCTSDTHVTAAKTLDAKGYLALGDIISVNEFVSTLGSLYEKAQNRLETGYYSSLTVQSQVKTVGGEILDDFSALMDKTSSVAKRGARILAVLGVVSVVAAII